MNKRRIIDYIMMVTVMVGCSAYIYTCKSLDNSSKKIVESNVVEAEKGKIETKASNISDEYAKEIAAKAMKDYLNKDSEYFSETRITRHNRCKNTNVKVEGEKYLVDKDSARWIQDKLDMGNIEGAKEELQWALQERPSVITVISSITNLDKDSFESVSIDINSDSKEILSAFCYKELEEYEGEVDENKISESINNFLDNINAEVDSESLPEKYDIDYNFGRVVAQLRLKDGKKISLSLDLKDYSVISYTRN